MLAEDLVSHTQEILSVFQDSPASSKFTMEWAGEVMQKTYGKSTRDMSHKTNGWHFGALRASEAKLTDFRIEDMAKKMKAMAPELWAMLGLMLSANHISWGEESEPEEDEDIVMGDGTGPEGTGRVADDVDIEGASNPNTGTQKGTAKERKHALDTIVSLMVHAVVIQLLI